ncbi:All-trans-nonaprenyl-diphosphate synthase (geranyl-diphosphate specific) [Novipirellula galeiformis]|uniref:All-trans-nonaprenyl-diphosphate synthase (Geranyl-diphosphate specific) n=1 Tax=Novipirellula galeiformis TaxID=2528004 RepID=A0A5C6CT29_9BACT|nr:polyprenyl synthetase family protein [Novipirellula galeiformis]TWU26206.1 All-trans-nonaprenyl-diphosphate synthase (geranyl-diphosphate specific) [Novipirellula galeiformis]
MIPPKESGLSTATTSNTTSHSAGTQGDSSARTTRRKTSHLKDVPPTLELRESLRSRCAEVAKRIDRSVPLNKDQMEQIARRFLEEADLPEGYLGWMMVMISSEFWKESLAAVPPERRLFLLPHCLKHAEGCPAEYDQFGMNCKECGACSIADFRSIAEEMGYRVLVAEGSPVVLKIIIGGYVDAVVGVACLNVLEKAIDKVLLAGIPCMAVPLLSSDCRNTKVDESWVEQMIRTPYVAASQKTRSYVHLMRAASELFESDSLQKLAPRIRDQSPIGSHAVTAESIENLDTIAATEHIAYDFLARGGKHSRPFITLAAYDAMTGAECTGSEGSDAVKTLPVTVQRAAMSIETFHKASLVHDDIEDDDGFRYGQPAVHQRFGLPTAINVGDYLIGLGYRLLSRRDADDAISADARVDVLDALATAHTRLAEGQGAELLWRDSKNRQLSPLDALKVYALKTSPAFEAALFSGIRLAGDAEAYRKPIRDFCRNLGVAFQILNDIGDWNGDEDNKLSAGGDLFGGRPTILWALALDTLQGDERDLLMSVVESPEKYSNSERLTIATRLYHTAGVFETAMQLVDKHQARAEKIADELEPESLRRLMYFLVDTVLERPEVPTPTLISLSSIPVNTLPIV